MNLLIQRDQQRTWLGGRQYVLHVTLVCSAEETAIITEHRLDGLPLFAVPEQAHLRQRAAAAFDRADTRSVLSTNGAGKLFTDNLAGLVLAARARFAFALSVADALKGATVICPDLHELLEAETQITTAFDALYCDVGNALAFSLGREQVLVPDDVDEPTGVPPDQWANHRHWRV